MNHFQKLIIKTAVFLVFYLINGNALSQKLTLDEAIKIALENNREIRTSKLNIEKEEAVKLSSFNIPRPELFLEYEGVKGSLKNFESRKIGILQELEFPTSYFLRLDVQGSQVSIAEEELKKLALRIKYEVGSAYLKLLLNYRLREIAAENLKIYNDFLFTAGKRYDAGSASNLEVLGAKVNKIKFENEIKNIESEIIAAKSELRKLMNKDHTETEPVDQLEFREITISKDEILRSAFLNNHDLKIMKFQKEKFSNKVSLTRSELLPKVSFRYYIQKIGDDADFWGIEFGIGLPLWFWWEPAGNIKEAGYELKIAESEEMNTKSTIENELNLTFAEYENSLRQVQFFQDEAIFEVNEILRQAKKSYEEGAIDYVEYLQALRIVYETRTQYLNSVFSYRKSIMKLENIIAGEIK